MGDADTTKSTPESTPSQKTEVVKKVNALPNEQAAKLSMSEEIKAKQSTATPSQRNALDKMHVANQAGKPISSDLMNEAGFSDNHFETKAGNVDMDTYGERMKKQLVGAIENPYSIFYSLTLSNLS